MVVGAALDGLCDLPDLAGATKLSFLHPMLGRLRGLPGGTRRGASKRSCRSRGGSTSF